MRGVEAVGLILSAVPIFLGGSGSAHVAAKWCKRWFFRNIEVLFTDGIFVMLLLNIIPGGHAAMQRIEKAISSSDEELSRLREPLSSSLNMVAVAGAIVAQIAITGLSLNSMTQAHWTAPAFLVASLVFGTISVYVSFVLQQEINGLFKPVDFVGWLSRLNSDEASRVPVWVPRRFAPPLRRIATGLSVSTVQQATSNTQLEQGMVNREPSPVAAIMLAAPSGLLGLSLNAFLIGFGIYLGCVHGGNLIPEYGKRGSLGILIFYIVAVIVVRRVKCDEARPACTRCTSTGRKCDGYQMNIPSPDSSSPKSAISSPASIISTYTTGPEARSFQFFIEKTLVNFQTFFPDDLWNTRVLQVAQSAECIKNAVVALAYYHELYLSHQQWQQLESVPALKHYNLAIKELLSPSSETLSQGHILVLSCLIFICIELLQGKTDSAISLFKYGCNMIQQFRKSAASTRKSGACRYSDAEVTLRLAEACLKRIAAQLLMLMGDVDPDLWLSFHTTFNDKLILPETSFASLADAREALVPILVKQASPGLKGKPTRDIMAHSAEIDKWGRSFDGLMTEYNRNERVLSDAESRAIALLQLHRRYLEVNVAKYIHGQGDPCFWDCFTAEFDEIVSYAVIAAGLDKNYTQRNWSTDSSPKAYFHVDLGFTSVLVSIIARCRDPFVRRRAIAVMLADRVQEGVFNGSQSARVAARVMELEEGRSGKEVKCSSDIPERARVRTIRVHLTGSENRMARIVYGFDRGCWEE
ncbi:hypothetical protein NW762_013017 [Fusarium torreyae]|uniref:Zn(2)-C6 fungal-type domain-containing protein n=1 Tax=Fusarium torreyae TaxID=1237075 RepID=A0A9W8V872_9HYPO|nr:hypothetical protein NW762_013017 [Fusarium torreyae]